MCLPPRSLEAVGANERANCRAWPGKTCSDVLNRRFPSGRRRPCIQVSADPGAALPTPLSTNIMSLPRDYPAKWIPHDRWQYTQPLTALLRFNDRFGIIAAVKLVTLLP